MSHLNHTMECDEHQPRPWTRPAPEPKRKKLKLKMVKPINPESDGC